MNVAGDALPFVRCRTLSRFERVLLEGGIELIHLVDQLPLAGNSASLRSISLCGKEPPASRAPDAASTAAIASATVSGGLAYPAGGEKKSENDDHRGIGEVKGRRENGGGLDGKGGRNAPYEEVSLRGVDEGKHEQGPEEGKRGFCRQVFDCRSRGAEEDARCQVEEGGGTEAGKIRPSLKRGRLDKDER